MGGQAIKIARRVPRERFFKYVKEIIPMVENAFQTKVHMVNGFTEKEDFGDLDLLILDNDLQDKIKTIEKHFNPQEISTTNINQLISFNYNELQVDLIFTPQTNWETSKIFYEWGDLGNFIGKLTNNFGRLREHNFSLKYGYDGFKCKIIHNGGIKNIFLTKDSKEVFRFLGLDFNRWKQGFKNREEVYDYIIGSKYFDHASFQWENLNSINKERNRRRPNYVHFLEYIENHKIEPKWDKGYLYYLNEIKEFFGVDLIEELEIIKSDEQNQEDVKNKFNGNIVMKNYPDIKGENLGKSMSDFKSNFDNWESFVSNNSKETILKKFDEFIGGS
tara:strand:- start:74394 stop:75389 length:996 start_codon:yes stop_codon:yes gene_type:complete